ncbi:MAG: FHA domain-containing protein [Solirubrobacteraceae bacterium]
MLNTAYADGLLSEETFVHRLDQVLSGRLIDPWRLVGDLNPRTAHRRWRARLRDVASATGATLRSTRSHESEDEALLLALDWNGGQSELLLGRSRDCDVVLASGAVSRRHARLFFRDGHWVVCDLDSTNGTTVNGASVGRCRLRPGDRVMFADTPVKID